LAQPLLTTPEVGPKTSGQTVKQTGSGIILTLNFLVSALPGVVVAVHNGVKPILFNANLARSVLD